MNKPVFAIKPLALLCLSSLSAPLFAQSTSSLESSETRFNPIIVTATLSAKTADETLASVTVIDEEQIRLQQPKDIIDLLKGQPGVDFSSNGGFGKTTSVYTRGAASDSTVLLVDGIRLQSATSGGASWQFLTPNLFERFEIVRGPRGGLYGADAAGGVIQGFLANSQAQKVNLSVGGGSFGSYQVNAGVSGQHNSTRYHLIANQFTTDGIEIKEGEGRRGYDNTSVLARLGQGFDSGADLSLLMMHTQGNTEFVGGTTDYRIQVLGLTASVPVTEHWLSRVQLSEARDENTSYQGNRSNFDTKTHKLRWENTLWADAHEFILGAETLKDSVETSSYAGEARKNHAVFAQGLFDLKPVSLQTNLRFDDNQVYGDKVTGGLAVGYAINPEHTLRGSYGTAFRAPTFNDLYWPGSGNLDLAPETSHTTEIGLRGQYPTFFWDIAVYEAQYKNLINWAPLPSGLWAPQNIDRARIRGIEFSLGAEVADWMLKAAITGTDPIDRADDTRLQRRTTKSVRFDADRTWGDWSVGGTLIAQGSRYNARRESDKMPGYGLVNLRSRWNFAPEWSATVTLDNLFDKDYVTTRGFGGWDYKNPGRSAFLTLSYSGL